MPLPNVQAIVRLTGAGGRPSPAILVGMEDKHQADGSFSFAVLLPTGEVLKFDGRDVRVFISEEIRAKLAEIELCAEKDKFFPEKPSMYDPKLIATMMKIFGRR